jgi:hypothetical protein
MFRFPWLMAGVLTICVSVSPRVAQSQVSGGNWLIDTRTNCQVLNSMMNAADGVRWSGACRNGLAEGTGTLQWLRGGRPAGTFVGELRTGLANGHGESTSPDGGERYEGDFHENKREGRGILFKADGSRYEGEFKNDQPDGHGVSYLPGGVTIEGEFKNGLANGFGVVLMPSGSRYLGNFRDGRYDGRGTFISNDNLRYDGEWRDGVQEGQGTTTNPDGTRIEVQMHNNKPNGYGCVIRPNGNRTCGMWRDGKMVSVD